MTYQEFLDSFEKSYLEASLKECGGNVRKTSRELKMSHSTLLRRLKKHHIKPQRERIVPELKAEIRKWKNVQDKMKEVQSTAIADAIGKIIRDALQEGTRDPFNEANKALMGIEGDPKPLDWEDKEDLKYMV